MLTWRGADKVWPLAALVAVLTYIPIGLYLQWALPVDAPLELILSLASLPLAVCAVWLLRRSRAPSGRAQAVRTACAIWLLVTFTLLQVSTLGAPLTRRIGPWRELRGHLVTSSEQVRSVRLEMGLLEDANLSPEEWALVEEAALPQRVEFTFPLVNRPVQIRMMSERPPYVGIDYGGGHRRVVFDLNTMRVLYAD